MAFTAHFRERIVSFEKGWPTKEGIIKKLISEIDGGRRVPCTDEEFTLSHGLMYDMCVFNSPAARVPEQLYDHYQKTCEDYVSSKVMPHLREMNGEILLRELVQQWGKYKTIRTGLSSIFYCLDRFAPRATRPSLEKTSNSVFYNLINRERNGEEIDQEVVKNALEIYIEMAEGSMKYYEEDFETAMIKDTEKFYLQKAIDLLDMNNNSRDLYVEKAMEFVDEEVLRVHNYLKHSSSEKILKVLVIEMLDIGLSDEMMS